MLPKLTRVTVSFITASAFVALAFYGGGMRAAVSFEVLHTFTGGPDGAGPSSALIQASDGNFYGTTSTRGAFGLGTIFKIAPDGTFSTLHDFTESEGTSSSVALVVGRDGNFYGTGRGGERSSAETSFGFRAKGGAGFGTVFQMTPAGAVTVVHAFTGGSDGANPAHSLIQGSDGNFYGTTDGKDGRSSVFRMTESGDVITLHSFTFVPDGAPNSLIQAADGNFYGTTLTGTGPFRSGLRSGTVFRLTPSGAFTVLHSFSSSSPVPEGTGPASLIQATDGNFYGTTIGGGAFGLGTIFKMTAAGALTTLHAFSSADGAFPAAALIQASDGNFYGTTDGGGASGLGTIFKMTPNGMFTTLYSPRVTNGSFAALIQARDEQLYGTRVGDVVRGNADVVFRISLN
jgi:uncharacterized repeat protein (TIGR03803 family)